MSSDCNCNCNAQHASNHTGLDWYTKGSSSWIGLVTITLVVAGIITCYLYYAYHWWISRRTHKKLEIENSVKTSPDQLGESLISNDDDDDTNDDILGVDKLPNSIEMDEIQTSSA